MNGRVRDEVGLELAKVWSLAATCSRRQVGAVIFDEHDRQISAGYNGSPAGMEHCLVDRACPRGRADSVPPDSDYSTPGTDGFCIAIHAEMNALHNAIKSVRGGRMFVTQPPCPTCMRELAGAGIVEVSWRTGSRGQYTTRTPLDELQRMAEIAQTLK